MTARYVWGHGILVQSLSPLVYVVIRQVGAFISFVVGIDAPLVVDCVHRQQYILETVVDKWWTQRESRCCTSSAHRSCQLDGRLQSVRWYHSATISPSVALTEQCMHV